MHFGILTKKIGAMRYFQLFYGMLLVYVVVALAFWEHNLQKQSETIYMQSLSILNKEIDPKRDAAAYHRQLFEIDRMRSARRMQYLGEGGTLMVVFLIGAYVVYRSLKYQLTLSKQQNNFMLSVTHELKSPLAGIKLNLQTLEKHKLDEEKRHVLLGRSIKEADRLNDLCNNILFASRLEGGNYKPSVDIFDFSQMAEDCTNIYSARYPHRFVKNISAGCNVCGDKIMLDIAVNNLLENAVKYSPDDKSIHVELVTTENTLKLCVSDLGAGIPDTEKKKIFQKFYRVGNEETRKKKGTGLGLYLANKVILQHKGQIAIRDNKPTGAIFEIVLPIIRA
jgi:signal transduction histidine kinase